MVSKIYKYLLILISILWVLFIFIDYFQKHPLYGLAIENFRYLGLVIFLLLIFGGLSSFIYKQAGNSEIPRWINGLSILGLFIFLASIITNAYHLKMFNSILGAANASFLAKLIVTLFGTFLVLIASMALGEKINALFNLQISNKQWLVLDMAIGISGLVLLLFILGALSLLKWFTVLPLLLLLIGLNYKYVLNLLKELFWKPLTIPSDINIVGLLSFFLLLFIICLNFLQIISPMPTGYDSMTIYVNLPSLINDYSGLVKGYQPYNWSLFMSIGFILFQKAEIAMALSLVGGVLTLWVMYRIGKDYLKMNVNWLWMALAAFYLMPTITHQSSKEPKVDLGALFIYITIVMVLYAWIRKRTDEKDKEHITEKIPTLSLDHKAIKKGGNGKPKKKKNIIPQPTYIRNRIKSESIYKFLNSTLNPYMIVMGLLTGFAMGIKLTTLFTFFSVVAVIWYFMSRSLAYLGIFCLSIFGVLLFKLDDMGDLRQYHMSASIVQWFMAVMGVALIGWSIFKKKEATLEAIKLSVIYTLFFIMPFLPWLAKNAVESDKVTVQTLLNGTQIGPRIGIQKIKAKFPPPSAPNSNTQR